MIFPPAIPHNSGTQLKLDNTLLLLGFRKPISRADVQHLLDQTSVRLEENVHVQEQNGNQIKRKVNHTNRLYWVHSLDGKFISDDHLGNLKHGLANELEWLGPVLRFPATKANPKGHPVCALPHVLIVKPKAEAIIGDLDHALVTLGLRYQADISQYLNGLRLYYLAPSSNPVIMHAVHQVLPPTAAHDLQITLRDKKFEDLVATTHLDYMPMFVPAASPIIDPMYINQWYHPQIKAQEGWEHAGWDIHSGPFPAGAGVRVAIIDDGVELAHQDLTKGFNNYDNRALSATFYTPQPNQTNNPEIGPPNGGLPQAEAHGTRCAGVLAARCNNEIGITGLAGACEIISLRTFGNIVSTFVAAVNYAVANHCHIISYSNADQSLSDQTVATAIENTFHQKVLICAAAGNYDTEVDYPARFQDYVIACGATDTNDDRCNGVWASSTGSGSNYGDHISVVAPGVNILTCDTSDSYFHRFEGTSSATPQVAALAALIMSRYPLLKGQPGRVRAIIEASADEVGTVTVVDTTRYPGTGKGDPLPYLTSATHLTKNWNWETGYGRINMFEAMKLASKVIRRPLDEAFLPIRDLTLMKRKRTSRRPPKIPPRPKTPPGPKKGNVREK